MKKIIIALVLTTIMVFSACKQKDKDKDLLLLLGLGAIIINNNNNTCQNTSGLVICIPPGIGN